MMNVKKKFSKHIEDTLEVKDQYELIASKLDFNEEEQKKGQLFMKKKILVLTSICAICVIGGVASGVAIGLNQKNSKANPTSYIVMDSNATNSISRSENEPMILAKNQTEDSSSINDNPTLSFCLDSKNKVISIKGENDAGKMIVAGEAFVGKDVKDAIKLAISIENETGYLVSGTASADQNNLQFTISADEVKIKEALQSTIQTTTENICSNLKIDEKVNYVNAYTKDKMAQLALTADPTLTNEQVNNMTYGELVNVISLYQVETAEIYSQELEDLYQQSKEYEIKFVDLEFTKNTISSLGEVYGSFVVEYGKIMDSLRTSIDSINEARYTYFVSEDSDYQKEMKELKNNKQGVLALQNEIAIKEDLNAIDKAVLSTELSLKIATLNTLISVMESAKEISLSLLDTTINSIQNLLDQMDEKLKALPNQDEVESTLSTKAQDLEKKINETKTGFYASFENDYGTDITRAKRAVTEYKNSLIEAVEDSKNK